VDPRAGLDDTEKWKFLTLPGLELRPLGRPASRYTDYAASEHLYIKRQPSEFILPPRRVRYWQLVICKAGIAVSYVHFAAKGTFPLRHESGRKMYKWMV
jgi:hypothetical protein